MVKATVPISSKTEGHDIDPWFFLFSGIEGCIYLNSLSRITHHLLGSVGLEGLGGPEGARTPSSAKKKCLYQEIHENQ